MDLLLLQEMKVFKNMERYVYNIWVSRRCGWAWVPPEGASGGLLTIWREGVLKVKEEVFKSSRVLSIRVLSLADVLIWGLANILWSE